MTERDESGLRPDLSIYDGVRRDRDPRLRRAGTGQGSALSAESGAALHAGRAGSPRQGGARRAAALGARRMGAGAAAP